MKNMDTRLKVRAFSAPWHNGVEFLIRQGRGVVTDLIMTQKTGGEVADPSFRLEYDMAQLLMDDLWNSGIRPTEGSGSAGSLRATEKHLADMRSLVASKLKVPLK